MRFEEISEILKDIPNMGKNQGKILYDFIGKEKIKNILELGFFHGTSTCYMAAALSQNGGGKITSIDQLSAKKLVPNIFDLMNKTKFNRIINPIFAEKSYTWELMKIIEANTFNGRCREIFDFCFIDGAHLWEPDGLAFFLIEKVLKPGGWILFDDLNWTLSKSPALRDSELVKNMPFDEVNTPQIKKVFELLVIQHPNFKNFRILNSWGWAQKKVSKSNYANTSQKIKVINKKPIKIGLPSKLTKLKKKLIRLLFGILKIS